MGQKTSSDGNQNFPLININSMRNQMSSDEYKSMLQGISSEHLGVKQEIDSLVQELRVKISSCDPLKLMNFLVSMFYLALINKTSEFQYEQEDNQTTRALEYVQSVLVSSESNYVQQEEEADESATYHEILNDVMHVQNKIVNFYFVWTATKLVEDENTDIEVLQYIVESQNSQSVKGDRYQYYQLEHIKGLIQPHHEVINELFHISVEDFLEGLNKLEYSLSSGKVDAFNAFGDLFDHYEEFIKSGKSEEEYLEQIGENPSNCVDNMFGYSLYNVKAVTGWSDDLINSLSLSLNSNDTFFSGEYAGWPIIDLPVHKKPFIEIGGISYCFDYYCLFDNIYRVMQKTIRELKPSYVNGWSHIQQHASEVMVEELMIELLPGCETYRDNYYPKGTSLKDCAENDILVVYDNVLIIVEVKAGSFVYTPAITDYSAHVSSFKALIEKADYQCERTLRYIESHPSASIYDRERNKKVELNYSIFSDVFTMCVTVDNFNEFAAKAEKLSFIKLGTHSISISIDDLRVYTDIFESPINFLHYLKQRKKAVQTQQLSLNDELDHLGLYLDRNLYTVDAEELEPKTKLVAMGFREGIDNYFASLHNTQLSFEKPRQYIPNRIQEIIDFMSKNNVSQRYNFSTFLLNYDYDGRDEIANAIDRSLERQRQINRMNQVSAYGDNRYCLFVHQPQIQAMSDKNKEDYIYASMLMHNEVDRLCISLYYGNHDELLNVEFKTITMSQIPHDRIEELKAFSERLFYGRVEKVKEESGKKKIGRNDPCPCGSRKKIKNCCIDKL
ncbi:SEC-C metal-binding domain-containing protein [Paenibacillus xylanexedens]|uniref:SEC-C metal-binding domain-containing protein n=1 Tax=Paenibacillus xylanexedens TaxID=528191 RepID=UPI003CFE4589